MIDYSPWASDFRPCWYIDDQNDGVLTSTVGLTVHECGVELRAYARYDCYSAVPSVAERFLLHPGDNAADFKVSVPRLKRVDDETVPCNRVCTDRPEVILSHAYNCLMSCGLGYIPWSAWSTVGIRPERKLRQSVKDMEHASVWHVLSRSPLLL